MFTLDLHAQANLFTPGFAHGGKFIYSWICMQRQMHFLLDLCAEANAFTPGLHSEANVFTPGLAHGSERIYS